MSYLLFLHCYETAMRLWDVLSLKQADQFLHGSAEHAQLSQHLDLKAKTLLLQALLHK